MTHPATIIACRECDCLQREVDPPVHGTAQCARCGAELFRNKPRSLEHTLAFLLAAAMFLVLANSNPLLALENQGVRNATTLFGASEALWRTQEYALATLVFMTTILFPALEVASSIYLLASLELGRVPRAMAPLMRLVAAIKPWGMISVFMLGALVSIVKLRSIATVEPGLALYSLGAFILMLTASEAAFEQREVWNRAGALRA
ncbi:MAG: paraquat-inducible protein A [Usitatibacter sp.]